MAFISEGYTIESRGIRKSDISKAPPCVRETYRLLIREANSADNKYGGHTIKRGQLFRDYKTIREDLSWFVGYRKEMYSENQMKKAMKFLRDTGRITTTKQLGGVLITVCNYDYYQNPKNYQRTKERTDESTMEEPITNQPISDNNKKEEELKNEKKILSQVDKSTLDATSQSYFEVALSFWQLIRNHLLSIKMSTALIDEAEFDTWVDPIRLLIENDKHTLDELREIFKFLRDDEFWIMQIRSTAKLRKKDKNGQKYFDTLLTIARNEKNRKPRKNGFHTTRTEEAISGAIRDITGN